MNDERILGYFSVHLVIIIDVRCTYTFTSSLEKKTLVSFSSSHTLFRYPVGEGAPPPGFAKIHVDASVARSGLGGAAAAVCRDMQAVAT